MLLNQTKRKENKANVLLAGNYLLLLVVCALLVMTIFMVWQAKIISSDHGKRQPDVKAKSERKCAHPPFVVTLTTTRRHRMVDFHVSMFVAL